MMARKASVPAADELPLDVAAVLDEEYRVLYEDEPEPEALPGWELTAEQLTNPGRYVAQLAGSTAVGRYVASRLPEDARRAVASAAGAVTPELVARVVSGVNALLRAEQPLYDETSLPEVSLDAELRTLVALPVAGEDRVHVNRILLERAFPGHIRRSYDLRLRAFYERAHHRAADPTRRRTALCFSGGGIRSATFGLGVIQGLADKGYLNSFDYLSTVSGGGYVGAWLTTWIHRHRDGTPGVAKELRNGVSSPLTPEPRPVHHLREYSNYLSPRLGLLSADTWTLAATYVRNLLLNWTVLIPLLLGVLAAPRLIVAVALADPGPRWREVALVVGLAALFVGVVYAGLFRPTREEARRRLPPWVRNQASQESFLLLCLAPLLTCAISLTTYWAWVNTSPADVPAHVMWWLLGLGAGVHVIAWVAYSAALRHFDARELIVSALTGGLAGLLVFATTRLLSAAPGWSFVEYYGTLAVPAFIVAFLLAATAFVGLLSRVTSDEDREWWARMGGWMLIVALGWVVGFGLVILGPPLLTSSWPRLVSSLSVGTMSGLVAILVGRSGNTPGSGQATAAAASSPLMDRAATVAAPVALAVLVALLSWATTASLPTVARLLASSRAPAVVVTTCTSWPTDHGAVLQCFSWWVVGLWMLCLLALAVLASRVINVNKFSLHAMYRARLIRAYLGASRERRSPNPFTGFDPLDNVQMHELRDEAFNAGSFKDLTAFVGRLQAPAAADAPSAVLRSHLSDETRVMLATHVPGTAPSSTMERALLADLNHLLDTERLERHAAFQPYARPVAVAGTWQILSRRNRALLEAAYPDEIVHRRPPPRKPLHVLNMALNLVGGHKLAWQERKAETFTVSELHAGSYHLGYRRARDYGGEDPRGISLGTAVAISGAAASPNMGYHSSPVVAVLMTMFNARLGWWLGNPGPRGHATFRHRTPRASIGPMLREALGMTDDQYKYVYLSDGGHFDNLGLLEMILRRCHFIVVSDAGCDPRCTFEDLGNAIRKVRIDLGVPITMKRQMRIRTRAVSGSAAAGQDSAYYAVADIEYSRIDAGAVNGVLVYVKPSFYGGEPIDVFNYAVAHATFPHETTADQFFSESQFESYRQLGMHTIKQVWPSTRL